MTKLTKFVPSSASRQVMQVRFNWKAIFLQRNSHIEGRNSQPRKVWSQYLYKISPKRSILKIAFWELSSSQSCLLRKKSYI